MIKLGPIMPLVYSGDGSFCLKYHLYSLGLATMINMKNNERIQLHLPKTIAACAISEHGDKICNIDGNGNVFITYVNKLKTEKISNLFSELSLSKDCMPRRMFFLDDANKIVTFIYFSQYKPREEYQCIIVTDILTKKSEVVIKINNSCFDSVERTDDEFTLFYILRKANHKNEFVFSRFNLPDTDANLSYESANKYGLKSWYIKNLSATIFDSSNQYFYAIDKSLGFPIKQKNLKFFDYKNKRILPKTSSDWKNAIFEYIGWLPGKSLFLYKTKGQEKYFIGNIETGENVAVITFDDYDVIIRNCFDAYDEVNVLASKKEFNFNNRSIPINSVYISSNKKFLVFENGKNAYAQDINVLLTFINKTR